ncbi:MAG TPA: hypothetical protein VK588_05535, partial [Chitinophagaceae bacterium]|nr:hypothetical protein [Chitinophagaceae bacterium]
SQDRPCVTIELSKKGFDVLPSFPTFGGGYMIPNRDLTTWTFSYPEQLTRDLDAVHRERKYRVKQVIKVAKYWNRDNNKLIPSYHIEESAISIFTLNDFTNFEEAIRLWFDNAATYLSSVKFKSEDDYNSAISKINKVKNKLTDAKEKYDAGKEEEAVEIWKVIFGREFPTVSAEEAKAFSKSFSDGTLKIGSTGLLSATAGAAIPASKGFYGDVPTL